MDKEIEDFVKLLNLPLFQTSNFKEIADEYSMIERDFEKKIYSAPLIGCGAGLILFASALVSNKLSAEKYDLVIPSLWAFFFGVVLAILAGIFYIWNVSAWKNESIERDNIQNIYKDIFPNMPTQKGSFVEYNSFNSVTKYQIHDAAKIMKQVKKLSRKGNICLFIARSLIVFSGIYFCIGVCLPLYKITVLSGF